MEVLPHQAGTLHWRSYDVDKVMWLEVIINTTSWAIIHSTDRDAADKLVEVLKVAESLNPKIDLHAGYNIWTRLQFDQSWGLGSSSTMLSLVAQWSGVDAFQLAAKTFGGSGYDIACATADGPIAYQRKDDVPSINKLTFDPSFKDQLCFVHLGEKKDTQDALKMYTDLSLDNKDEIQHQIAEINKQILGATSISIFFNAIDAHETLISDALDMKKVKDERFADFNGYVKSLGAWGGDFVLAASDQRIDLTIAYFQNLNYRTVLSWEDMILSSH